MNDFFRDGTAGINDEIRAAFKGKETRLLIGGLSCLAHFQARRE
jgi:hypothetical protein